MTPQEADAAQEWKGMCGATAYMNIESGTYYWVDAGQLLEAWLRANGGSIQAPCVIHK